MRATVSGSSSLPWPPREAGLGGKGEFMRNKIIHPHPDPLPSREREVKVKELYRKIATSACRPARNDILFFRTAYPRPSPLYFTRPYTPGPSSFTGHMVTKILYRSSFIPWL